MDTYSKGLLLEQKVADIYSQLGAQKILTNTKVAGQQVDVYAEMRAQDGCIARYGIECKNFDKNVPINEVIKSCQRLSFLRLNNHIDFPIIVAKMGFTADGKTAAIDSGVRIITLGELLKSLVDFSPYLTSSSEKYVNTVFFKKNIYRQLECKSDEGLDLGVIDSYVGKWFEGGGNFLTILGDYGTGKTTYAQRLFWEMAGKYISNETNNRIPIYIPLKKYRKEIAIRSLIIDLLIHDYDIRIPNYTIFKKLNEEGRLTIIFDAFDEMAAGADENEIINNFREIKTLVCDKSQILLTCRTHYFKDQDQIYKVHEGTALYDEIALDRSKYSICYLCPFTQNDVEVLIEKYDPIKKTRYLKLIDNTYNLKELARHPILLDMILKTLPELLASSKIATPSDLYRIYTRDWLNRDDWRSKMPHDLREFFMKELAFYFQSNNISEIHYRNLPRYIKRKFPGLRTLRELDVFDSDVRTCTFLNRDSKGNYSFVHRSFSEYFAALRSVELVMNGKWPRDSMRGDNRPNDWISPETANFTIDMISKEREGYNIVLKILYTSIDGYLLLNVLTIYEHARANDEIRRKMYSIIRNRLDKQELDGIPYRNDIRAKIPKRSENL